MELDQARIKEGDLESKSVIINITNRIKECQMGDQYIANQVGIQGRQAGPHAKVKQSQTNISPNDIQRLLKELKDLRDHLKQSDPGEDHDIEAGKVAEAEKELSAGDKKGFLDALRLGGKWVLQKARDAGCTLLVKYLEGQIGN
jgi:ribosomal protein S15P/S13E